jgi:hypothetical protein
MLKQKDGRRRVEALSASRSCCYTMSKYDRMYVAFTPIPSISRFESKKLLRPIVERITLGVLVIRSKTIHPTSSNHRAAAYPSSAYCVLGLIGIQNI